MADKKQKKIKLDALNGKEPIKGKAFDYDHAVGIMKIQEKNNRKDWTISPDEKLIFKDGDFKSDSSKSDSKGGKSSE